MFDVWARSNSNIELLGMMNRKGVEGSDVDSFKVFSGYYPGDTKLCCVMGIHLQETLYLETERQI
jgi:hypothetical protein